MSKLFYNETGHVIHHANEELTRSRHARVRLNLPDAFESGGTLYIYAAAHMPSSPPLQVDVNGKLFACEADDDLHPHWYALKLAKEELRTGENIITLWCKSRAMDGWKLGIEGGHPRTTSAMSVDAGKTWQSEQMGVYNRMTGEYVVRLRLDDPALSDPEPPAFAEEDPDHPDVAELREMIPLEIREVADPWEKARALLTWVTCQWPYRRRGNDSSPWDPFTILSWAKREHGHYGPAPTAMCVHYGIVYACAGAAIGLPCRNVVLCGEVNGWNGHFVAEVWMDPWQKWCQVDPSGDAVFLRDGVPLSVAELCLDGKAALDLMETGPGLESLNAKDAKEFVTSVRMGAAYDQWGVWPRNDHISNPLAASTSHGLLHYSETEWLWKKPDDPHSLDMFPHLLDADRLARREY